MARQAKRDVETPDSADEALRVVADRLREARLKAGLTQAQLGTVAGVRQSYVGELEQANITIKTLCRMADRLGVDVRELLPEGPSLPPTKASIERLAEAFDNLAQVMRERTGQDAELLVALRGFVGLREAIEAWAKSGKMPF